MAVFKYIKHFESFLNADQGLNQHVLGTLSELAKFQKVLLLTTSNRYTGAEDVPKSTMIAEYLHSKLPQSTLIDVSKLNIHNCTGNVSTNKGNNCGVKEALLKDNIKNPSNQHRCWTSFANPDDELWRISKELFESDCVMFFVSVRWGQTNAMYQKLIERLTWLENRHTSLGEENLIKDKTVGVILIGQNWNGHNVLQTQRNVLNFFGFKTNDDFLFWNWQFTQDAYDERLDSYNDSNEQFKKSISNI